MERSGSGHETLGEVRDRLGDLGAVWNGLGRSGTGSGTLGKVRDGSGDPQRGPGRVRGPSESSGTGQGTIREVRDGSREP